MKSVDTYPVPREVRRSKVDALVVIQAAGERLFVIRSLRALLHDQLSQ